MVGLFKAGIFTIGFLIATQSMARVNLMTGAFQTKDRTQIGTYLLDLNYSSRSLHKGYFGFGWCSDWEWKLNLKKGKKITASLQHCDEAESQISDSQLTANESGFRILASNLDVLTFDKTGKLLKIQRQNADRESVELIYNSEGRLFHFNYQNTKFVIFWEKGLIHQISLTSGQNNSNPKVVSFGYLGSDLVQSPKGKYKYLDHNIVAVENSETQLSLKYDEQLDILSGYENLATDCSYKFQYPDSIKNGHALAGLPSAYCRGHKRNLAGQLSN